MSKLSVDIKVGETLMVGETKITLLAKSGQLARLVVHAPDCVTVVTPKQHKARLVVLNTNETEHTTHG